MDWMHPVLRFWRQGSRRDFSGAAFWGLVAAHMRGLRVLPAASGLSIVMSHTCPDQIALFLALIAGGRQPALFPPSNSVQDDAAYLTQQRESLGRIGPQHLFVFDAAVGAKLVQIDAGLGSRVVLVEAAEPELDGAEEARAAFLARLEDAAPIFVQHSSGTTGVKKAVAISGRALAAQYASYWPGLRSAYGLERLAIASWLPLYHDMGLLTSLLLPAIGGDCVSIVDPFEWIGKPGLLAEMIEADRCEIAWLPNFAFRHLTRLALDMAARDLSSMRAWIDCSEPCRMADAAGFEAAFAGWGVAAGSVLGCYAMAESVFAVTQCAPGEQRGLVVPAKMQLGDLVADVKDDEPRRHVLSSGRVLPDTQVAVLADGVALPDGYYGEIAIAGSSVFGGYRQMSRAESNFTEDGYFRTGDLGAMIDGHLFVFGRVKEIIIVNGKNLFAGDVEDAVNAIAGVKPGRAVAIGMENAQTGSEDLIVIAERDSGSAKDARGLRAEISRALTQAFLVTPRDVRVVEERWLVKSTSGKISRGENSAKYLATFRAGR